MRANADEAMVLLSNPGQQVLFAYRSMRRSLHGDSRKRADAKAAQKSGLVAATPAAFE